MLQVRANEGCEPPVRFGPPAEGTAIDDAHIFGRPWLLHVAALYHERDLGDSDWHRLHGSRSMHRDRRSRSQQTTISPKELLPGAQ